MNNLLYCLLTSVNVNVTLLAALRLMKYNPLLRVIHLLLKCDVTIAVSSLCNHYYCFFTKDSYSLPVLHPFLFIFCTSFFCSWVLYVICQFPGLLTLSPPPFISTFNMTNSTFYFISLKKFSFNKNKIFINTTIKKKKIIII